MGILTETVKAYAEIGASQEQIETGDYAERYINSLNNIELLELMDDAHTWADSLSAEELEARGLN